MDRAEEDRRHTIMSCVTWEQVLKKMGLQAKKRSSGVLVGLCVFHQEKTASLNYWQSGNFHCYGCHYSGDMIDFVSNHLRCRPDDKAVVEFFNYLPTLPDPDQLSFL